MITAYYVYRSGSSCLTVRVRSSTPYSLIVNRTRQPFRRRCARGELGRHRIASNSSIRLSSRNYSKRLHSFCNSNRLTVSLVSAVGSTTHRNTSVYFVSSRPIAPVSTRRHRRCTSSAATVIFPISSVSTSARNKSRSCCFDWLLLIRIPAHLHSYLGTSSLSTQDPIPRITSSVDWRVALLFGTS